MTKHDMLIIRACKGGNTMDRLQSIHRRFYIKTDERSRDICIIHFLVRIIKLLKINVDPLDLIVDLDQNNFKYGQYDYYKRAIMSLSNVLMMCTADQLPTDYIPQLKIRKNLLYI